MEKRHECLLPGQVAPGRGGRRVEQEQVPAAFARPDGGGGAIFELEQRLGARADLAGQAEAVESDPAQIRGGGVLERLQQRALVARFRQGHVSLAVAVQVSDALDLQRHRLSGGQMTRQAAELRRDAVAV